VKALLLTILLLTGPASAAAAVFSEEAFSFRADGLQFEGTILLPAGSGPFPALVLVHGAGPGSREAVRAEAEAFTRAGILTLIYDKRTEGYSQFERSFDLLAGDALAALSALQDHPAALAGATGLWGLSEGAWVVPLAAARSSDVAFVVLVAATGVPPAQQHSWNVENILRQQGISGSLLKAASRTSVRLLVTLDLLAEAGHDPLPPLEALTQPVLALWGENDRVQPPAESALLVRAALERGGNDRYLLRFFPDAGHGLHVSRDGFHAEEGFAPGYAAAVATWVQQAARGAAPGPLVQGTAPQQETLSRPLAPLAWWESQWLQLALVVVPALAFISFLAGRFRNRKDTPDSSTRRAARFGTALAGTGLLALTGSVSYLGYLLLTGGAAAGPLLAGTTLPWLLLQLLSVAAAVSGVLLLGSLLAARAALRHGERLQSGLLLAGGALFAAWALYWGLLLP
jgi:dienelactone hydrolase